MEQKELFDDPSLVEPHYSTTGFDDMDELLQRLGEISPNARDDAIRALLSEYPLRQEVYRFVQKILDAAAEAADTAGPESEAVRRAAERARTDRLDPGTERVQIAAAKTTREFDRLRGLLRFRPENGIYTARCTPDHFVLPLLAGHFEERFGAAPWAIIDEKRNLLLKGGIPGSTMAPGGAGITDTGTPVLCRIDSQKAPPDAEPNMMPYAAPHTALRQAIPEPDTAEKLWKQYHRSVNNEERVNPSLQKQFMPKRYWKYLPEMDGIE